jgi:hypothetical protein
MTTDDIMKLAAEYTDESYELRMGHGYNPEPEKALRAAIEQLVNERDALKADAERYRYVREGHGDWAICYWSSDDDYMSDCWVFDARDPKYVDAAIDAARGEKT